METAVELCRLAAKNRVDDLLVWQLAGVDLNACDYDKRTPLHVVSVAREILISLVAIVTSDTSLKTSMILPSPPPRPCWSQRISSLLPSCFKGRHATLLHWREALCDDPNNASQPHSRRRAR